MSFYSGLRDKSAKLLARFGQDASYRTYSDEAYNNATGRTSKRATVDTPIKLLEMKGSGPKNAHEWSEEIARVMRVAALISADTLFAAGITPQPEEHIVYQGKENRILGIKRLSPAGEPVIYTVALQYV
jgi:hypothetical protein